MKISYWGSLLVSLCVKPSSWRRKFYRKLRKLLLKFGWNPAVRSSYFDRDLIFPLRHDLVLLTCDHDQYNTPLRRLCRYIRSKRSALVFIDIGANIADGVSLTEAALSDQYILVEGSQSYLPFLKKNVEGISFVKVVEAYLSDRCESRLCVEVVENSTARLQGGEGEAQQFVTLDAVFSETEATPDIIKMDIEGHETRVIRGADAILRKSSAILYMEWHEKLLRRENTCGQELMSLLRLYGYNKCVAYDNLGILHGSLSLSDEQRLTELSEYMMRKNGFYFDIIIFHESSANNALEFLELEKAFLSLLLMAKI